MVCILRTGAIGVAVVTILAAAGCGIDKSGSAPLTGPSTPSEFALSVTLTATPDQLPRNGSSKSTVTVLVRDAQGRPVSGQRLSVSANIGSVSQPDVTTNADGTATFTFTAPPFGSVGSAAVVQAIPVGGNGSNAVGRTVSILLTGIPNATAPTPDFTLSSLTPLLGDSVSFDASTTTDEGVRCGDACTYEWDFGGESTGFGRVVSYRFLAVRSYAVKLTVTDTGGSSASVTKTLTVSQGDAPAAVFVSSPASPAQFEDVQFNGSSSRAGAGRTIVSYEWKFGDGATGIGATVTHQYTVLGTYQVTLTVTDSVGLKNTTTNPVAVVNGVAASFIISPAPTQTSRTTIFNAEGSQGSGSGFGTRNPIVTYTWNFGDTTATEDGGPIISHQYSSTGVFTITLTVVDSLGRRATTNKSLTVN